MFPSAVMLRIMFRLHILCRKANYSMVMANVVFFFLRLHFANLESFLTAKETLFTFKRLCIVFVLTLQIAMVTFAYKSLKLNFSLFQVFQLNKSSLMQPFSCRQSEAYCPASTCRTGIVFFVP